MKMDDVETLRLQLGEDDFRERERRERKRENTHRERERFSSPKEDLTHPWLLRREKNEGQLRLDCMMDVTITR